MTSALLFFVAGALAGGFAMRLASRRPGRAPVPQAVPPMPDELFGSDTATHLAADLASESSYEPLARMMVERCAVRAGVPCALVMRERVGAAAFITAISDEFDSRLLGMELPLGSPAGRAITEGIPVVGGREERVISIDRRDRRRYSGGGVAVPLAQGGQVYGAVLAFGDPPAGAQQAVEGIAQEVRKFIPVVIPAYAAAVAARRAATDELTGLGNRRTFDSLAHRVNAGDKVALVVFDVDHFKAVNDELGHQAGDAALRQIARLTREVVRPKDTAARIGGEEFALWLPGADLATGQEVAERLRAAVAANPFRLGGIERTITISCGVAAYPVPQRAVENLMGAADAALYAAKRGGRNQVVASRAAAG